MDNASRSIRASIQTQRKTARSLMQDTEAASSGSMMNVVWVLAIGLALLPIVIDFSEDALNATQETERPTLASIVDFLPVVYVLVLLGGVAFYLKKNA